MLSKLLVKQGSHDLALLLEIGHIVYVANDKSYYIDCSKSEIENLGILTLIEGSDVDVGKLTKVVKPSSIMGLWAYHLALKIKDS